MPIDSITGHSSLPAGVRWYSPPTWSTTPTRSSVLSRLDSSAGDISGTPRRRSLKRVLPHSSSRTTSGVHLSVSTSEAMATGQN